MTRLHPLIARELEACPFPWTAERGAKHTKIKVQGTLAGIVPLSGGDSADQRAAKNVRSQIRRTVKRLQAE